VPTRNQSKSIWAKIRRFGGGRLGSLAYSHDGGFPGGPVFISRLSIPFNPQTLRRNYKARSNSTNHTNIVKNHIQNLLVVLAVLGGIQKSFAPVIPGELQVNIFPPAVVAGGAEWEVDGGPTQYTNGQTVSLQGGSHTVSFTPVTGWSNPPNATVSIVFDQITITNGTYVLTNAPALAVSLTTTNSAMVSWPSPSTGWNLQQNTDLTTANWTTPPETITDNGTIKYIIVNPPKGNLFFRLQSP
jgi:hypothetical protein